MNPQQQAYQTREFLETSVRWTPRAPMFIDNAVGRIMTDGANDYYDYRDGMMLFEKLDTAERFRMLEEELLDAANYCYMLAAGDPDNPIFGRVADKISALWTELQYEAENDPRPAVTTKEEG